MELGDDDHAYILDTLNKGQERLEELRQENRKLREANSKLVQLVEKLEAIVEDEEDSIKFEGSEYEYPGKWTPSDIVHEENLDIDRDSDLEEIDSQISEAIKSLKRAQKFKNE